MNRVIGVRSSLKSSLNSSALNNIIYLFVIGVDKEERVKGKQARSRRARENGKPVGGCDAERERQGQNFVLS